jgi:hypothetical protein
LIFKLIKHTINVRIICIYVQHVTSQTQWKCLEVVKLLVMRRRQVRTPDEICVLTQ